MSADTPHGALPGGPGVPAGTGVSGVPAGTGEGGIGAAEVPVPPATGDPDVDAALARLAAAAAGTPEQQVGAFDAVHRTLQDRLADVEG